MKANELMIGDWVMLDKSRPLTSKKPTQITLTDMIFIARKKGEECEPIPLTEEILKVNGFEPLQKMWYIKDTFIGVDWNGNEIKECRFGEDVLYFGHTNHKIKYVHELQHALRLCGMSELADNFKV